MTATMQHHADSSSGMVFAPELGVYGGWVAHADSYAARQSAQHGGAVRLMLSGECHGGDTLPGSSLCRRYEVQGPGFVAGLNGLFAGLLIDRANGRALLFNDRYGSERLYAFEKHGATYFASEAKALLAVLPELRAFDDTGVAQFLAFGSTIGGQTLFRGLRLIPGGSLWQWAPPAQLQRNRYFTPRQWEALAPLTQDEFETRFDESFVGLLPHYLRADQPVGLSLTGGLDTRMILACLPHDQAPTVAYTYAAEGSDALLDLRIARRLAALRGVPHHALRVDRHFLEDFGHQLDRTVHVTDGCAGVLGAHELYLSKQARQLAPVRLTGNFGSELLRSMSTFKRNGPRNDLLQPALADRVDAVAAEQRDRIVHPVTCAAFEEIPWHLFGTLAASRSLLSVRTPYLDNSIVELAFRALPHMRRSSASALRTIQRADPQLAAIATDRGLRSAAPGSYERLQMLSSEVAFKLDYWHKEGLPDRLTPFDALLGSMSHLGLLGLHKFLAYRLWFRRQLAPYAQQVITDSRTRNMSYWNADALKGVVPDHTSGRRNRLRDIHVVLTLEAVHRMLIDAHAYPVTAPALALGNMP